jgi:class 3 adenylate cyclase
VTETKLCLVKADLAGFARACTSKGALEIAQFLDDWYRQSAPLIIARGGRVVKFMGDAVLAVFPEAAVLAAVDAATTLRAALAELRARTQWRIDLGANVHLAIVAEGLFGPDDDRRYDVFGSGVNHLFLMGGGPGIRISEPVFRQLPNEVREAWNKQRPPATYTFDDRHS